jgi:putative transposase
MSIDRSLKGKDSLERHRNVLTRAERIAKLEELGKWTDESTAIGMPKVGHRKIAVGKKDKADKAQRFEAGCPLELAQMDILEFFVNKLKVYLILLIDDFSRFILGWQLLTETSTDEVTEVVRAAISRYGKMQELLTDRGFVFYSWRGINRFERYLQNESIDHTHARPHHPQTLGKVEACNRRIKNELFNQQRFSNIHDAKAAIESWVDHYNYKRTHQGIGGLLVPAERFHGQVQQAVSAIVAGQDAASAVFGTSDIERSIISLVASPGGQLTLYIMGRPIELAGGCHVRETEQGRSRYFNTGKKNHESEGL